MQISKSPTPKFNKILWRVYDIHGIPFMVSWKLSFNTDEYGWKSKLPNFLWNYLVSNFKKNLPNVLVAITESHTDE